MAFSSAAKLLPGQVHAVILTGMGRDGTLGAARLREQDGTVWAQDEASSAIYGMPRAALQAGVVDEVLPLGQIAAALTRLVR